MKDGLTPEQQNIVDEIQRTLLTVRLLPDPDRSRCLLCLAYEYFVMDMEEEAYKLLKEADKNYFGDQLRKDTDEIPGMSEILVTILNKLTEIGLVKIVTDK